MKTYKSIYNKVEKLEEKANALISEFGDNYVYSDDSETFFATYIECDKESNVITITTSDYLCGDNVQVYELDNEEDKEEVKDYLHDLNIYLNRGKRHLKYYDINKEEEDEDYSTKFAEESEEEEEEVSENEEEPANEEEEKTYFIISDEKRNEIYSSFDSALNGVNLSEVSKEDLNETLYNIATDMLVNEFHKMENSAANNGIRDFNVLNEIRCSKINELISNYLNKKDMITFDSFTQELANVLNKRLNKEFKTIKTDSDGFINNDNIQLSFDNKPFADGLFFAEIYVKNVDRLFIVTYHKDNTFTLQENKDNGEIIYIFDNVTELNLILNYFAAFNPVHKEVTEEDVNEIAKQFAKDIKYRVSDDEKSVLICFIIKTQSWFIFANGFYAPVNMGQNFRDFTKLINDIKNDYELTIEEI